MRTKLAILSLAALAVAIACCTACGRAASADGPETALELRSYEVPEAYRNEIKAQLRYVLQGSEASQVGRVAEGTGNRLIVLAPAEIHEGLRSLLHDLEGAGPVPPPPQVRLTYWLVMGWPAPAEAATGRPFIVSGPAGLREIEPALAGIAEAQGPTEFRLLERMEIVSTGQDWARARGRLAGVGQRTAVNGEAVVAELDISLGRQSLATEVVIRPGQHLVLGQTGATDEASRAFGDGRAGDVTLYYVVAADF